MLGPLRDALRPDRIGLVSNEGAFGTTRRRARIFDEAAYAFEAQLRDH